MRVPHQQGSVCSDAKVWQELVQGNIPSAHYNLTNVALRAVSIVKINDTPYIKSGIKGQITTTPL
jgi:hypothetical protein